LGEESLWRETILRFCRRELALESRAMGEEQLYLQPCKKQETSGEVVIILGVVIDDHTTVRLDDG
jgi:hypothetical protein